MQLLEKYRLNFKIDEDMDNSEVIRAREKITAFTAFVKKSIQVMDV